MDDVLLTAVDVGRRLGVTSDRVRQLADAGALRFVRTASGIRLFASAEVERLRRERAGCPAREAEAAR